MCDGTLVGAEAGLVGKAIDPSVGTVVWELSESKDMCDVVGLLGTAVASSVRTVVCRCLMTLLWVLNQVHLSRLWILQPSL